ncbi:GNAT family N-acetyltransferase [Alkalicoccobacillus porphyridii]|uniref:GNAT family N-acetyltransferase n=1 Tax=Alkalicoccobacillus porphyridii TaxID=2597270 RepID=A0A553ZVY5_9BACI|nr:N-acetyltransferase [Alkalicoccobacillus porphyridii]TSB45495.1 GNAT family N-acetyltransferase [Alkalicoccobacillus porphyridii]
MIKPLHNAEDIASFIHELNVNADHHIGYVGTDLEEITDTLKHDFSDFSLNQSVIGAYEGEELVALIAFDVDEVEATVEVWGPFLKNPDNEEAALKLWHTWWKNTPCSILRYYLFPNVHNYAVIEFANAIGARPNGEHYVLSIERSSHQPLTKLHTIVPFHEKDTDAIAALHNEHFPDTYLSVEDMVSSLDSNNKLFLYKENDVVKGYVYVEADPKFEESDIHYIAVKPEYRGQGIGTLLLHEATTFLFSFSAIQNISLCVSADSEDALFMYKKAHFTLDHQLISLVGKT